MPQETARSTEYWSQWEGELGPKTVSSRSRTYYAKRCITATQHNRLSFHKKQRRRRRRSTLSQYTSPSNTSYRLFPSQVTDYSQHNLLTISNYFKTINTFTFTNSFMFLELKKTKSEMAISSESPNHNWSIVYFASTCRGGLSIGWTEGKGTWPQGKELLQRLLLHVTIIYTIISTLKTVIYHLCLVCAKQSHTIKAGKDHNRRGIWS